MPTKKNKNRSSTLPKGLVIGNGGETHQITDRADRTLTTQHGIPISDNQNSLKIGQRGPTLLEDFRFREKMFHFDHERIPERVVHARGFGAHGYFETYQPLTAITSADLFQRKGEKTPVFVRFSTVAGNKGSPDLARDVRGFAVKFYTKQGNWDLVGNNIPVFFIQDAIKFPDLIHAAKAEPDSDIPQAQTAHDNFWDFISLMPESMHMIMWAMSDRAIPRSYRFMEGFGVHTFRLINAKGKSHFVKFHWKPKLGLQSVIWDEAVKINGADPDFHRRDLSQAIKSGNYPEWELGLQIFDEKFADKFLFDTLDATKLIPEEDLPVQIVGKLILNRCVDNFFAETEQVAFCTQNIVPGIDFSNDPLLQGRNFSYLDTQIKRLGSPNFTHLPINAPKCPFHHFQQDGHMSMMNPKGRVNYEPNSWDNEAGPRENPSIGFKSYPEELSANKMAVRSESFADHYSQARQFFISQTDIEQEHILNAFAFELSKVEKVAIRERLVAQLMNVDETLAKKLAGKLRLKSLPQKAVAAKAVNKLLKKSPALSIILNNPKTLEGRKIGILLTDGADAKLFELLTNQIKKMKAIFEIIAPEIGGVQLNDGTWIEANKTITGGPSVLFDSIVILISAENVLNLSKMPSARDFVTDAYAHFKYLGYTHEAVDFFTKIGLSQHLDEGFYLLNDNKSIQSFLDSCKNIRCWARQKTLLL